MKRATVIFAATALLAFAGNRVEAGTIAGPASFPIIGSNDTLWGIQFNALENATLTGFDFNHHPDTFGQPFSGTISVIDTTTSTTIYSTNYGAGTTTVIPYSGLSIALVSGHVYQLVATSDIVSNANDEVYSYTSFPASDAQISVTQGVFNNNPGFTENNAWAAFNNIVTTTSVPEPGTFVLLGIGFVGLAGFARARRGRRAA